MSRCAVCSLPVGRGSSDGNVKMHTACLRRVRLANHSMFSRESADNARLSNMKNDEDVVGAVVRLIGAVGRRAATADPDQAVYFRMIRDQLDQSIRLAVDGWRSQGFSDAQIGRELGVTRQAVRQRWPRQEAA